MVISYLSCGILGAGLQGRAAVLLLDYGNLLFGASVPWGRVFAGAEDGAREEADELEAAFALAQAALPFANAESSERLAVFVGPNGLEWKTLPGGEVRRGDAFEALLDRLDQCGGDAQGTMGAAGSGESFELPVHQWIAV